LFTTGGTHQPPLVNRNGLVFLDPKIRENRGKSGKIGYFFVFFGPRGLKSGSGGKSGKNMMKGSQIWGSENGVRFIAGKSGSEIGGGFFIAGKSGVVFLMKFGEISEFGVGGDFRGRVGNREKDGMDKFGDGEKRGWENVPEGMKR